MKSRWDDQCHTCVKHIVQNSLSSLKVMSSAVVEWEGVMGNLITVIDWSVDASHPRRGRTCYLGKKFFCPTQIWITIVCVFLELNCSSFKLQGPSNLCFPRELLERLCTLSQSAKTQGEITTFHIFSWTHCTWYKPHNSSANKKLPPSAPLPHPSAQQCLNCAW